MTAALVRHHTAGTSITSGTTVAAAVVTADVAAGNVLVAWVEMDNLSTVTPAVSSLSKPAGETATWAMIAAHNSTSNVATAGVRGEMWVIKATVAWTVATAVTATLSGAVASKAILLSEFSGVTVTLRGGGTGTGTSTVGTPSATTTGTNPVAGDLVLGGGGFEQNAAPTADADTTNGSWSAAYTAVANSGSAQGSVSGILQYKVVSANGAQTFNPTASSVPSGAAAVALAVNRAPNASTLTSPATGTTVDRAVTQRLGWTFSDPDVGDSQSAFDLQYKLGAGSWVPITGTLNGFWDATGGTFAAGSYEWQVRTYDADGLVGPWSASSFFDAADTPGVPSITAPTSGGTIATTSATVTWSTAAQTDYQVRKMDDVAGVAGTTVYYDSGDVVDATTRSVTLTFPTNLRWEHIQVRVKAAGLWSTWADSRNPVSWTAPMVPTATATPGSALASIAIAITNPAPTGGAPAVAYNDVYVSSPLDPEYRAATLVTPNSTWTWRLPGAGRPYQFRVSAVGSNGTTRNSDNALVGVAVGDAFMGGYFAGVIDTTVGNIIEADASQVGVRYALVVAPKSLEQEWRQYKTTNDLSPAAARTRWDGLAATAAMAADAATYPAADYCNGLVYPGDGGSPWYLPAMDELELLYRNLKLTTEANYVAGRPAGVFPGIASNMGVNASSDPAGAAYTTGSPAQTSVLPFRLGGAQALIGAVGSDSWYWSSTEYAATDAWGQHASGGYAGLQGYSNKYNDCRVRPVRRFVL